MRTSLAMILGTGNRAETAMRCTGRLGVECTSCTHDPDRAPFTWTGKGQHMKTADCHQIHSQEEWHRPLVPASPRVMARRGLPD